MLQSIILGLIYTHIQLSLYKYTYYQFRVTQLEKTTNKFSLLYLHLYEGTSTDNIIAPQLNMYNSFIKMILGKCAFGWTYSSIQSYLLLTYGALPVLTGRLVSHKEYRYFYHLQQHNNYEKQS